eukprot:g1196.t1
MSKKRAKCLEKFTLREKGNYKMRSRVESDSKSVVKAPKVGYPVKFLIMMKKNKVEKNLRTVRTSILNGVNAWKKKNSRLVTEIKEAKEKQSSLQSALLELQTRRQRVLSEISFYKSQLSSISTRKNQLDKWIQHQKTEIKDIEEHTSRVKKEGICSLDALSTSNLQNIQLQLQALVNNKEKSSDVTATIEVEDEKIQKETPSKLNKTPSIHCEIVKKLQNYLHCKDELIQLFGEGHEKVFNDNAGSLNERICDLIESIQGEAFRLKIASSNPEEGRRGQLLLSFAEHMMQCYEYHNPQPKEDEKVEEEH